MKNYLKNLSEKEQVQIVKILNKEKKEMKAFCLKLNEESRIYNGAITRCIDKLFGNI